MAEKLEPYARLNGVRARWADTTQRAEIFEQLAERGIDFQTVAAQAGKPDADPIWISCATIAVNTSFWLLTKVRVQTAS